MNFKKNILSYDEDVDIGGKKEYHILDSSIFYVSIIYFNILFKEIKNYKFDIEEKNFIDKILIKLFVYIENNKYNIKDYNELMTFFEFLIFNLEYILYRLTNSTASFVAIDSFTNKIVDTHIFSYYVTTPDSDNGMNVILVNEMKNICDISHLFEKIKNIASEEVINGHTFKGIYSRNYYFVSLPELNQAYDTLKNDICEFMKIEINNQS